MKELADYKDKLTDGHVELEEVLKSYGKVFAEELPDIYSNIVQLNKEIIWYVSANMAICYWETLAEPDESKKLPKNKRDKLKTALSMIDGYSGCAQFEKEIGCPIMADIRKATQTPLDVQETPCTGKDTGKSASGVGPTDAPTSADCKKAASSSKSPASGGEKVDECTSGGNAVSASHRPASGVGNADGSTPGTGAASSSAAPASGVGNGNGCVSGAGADFSSAEPASDGGNDKKASPVCTDADDQRQEPSPAHTATTKELDDEKADKKRMADEHEDGGNPVKKRPAAKAANKAAKAAGEGGGKGGKGGRGRGQKRLAEVETDPATENAPSTAKPKKKQ